MGYKQTDFGETCAPIGKPSTFGYLISLIGKYGTRLNMDHVDVTAFLNPEIDNEDIYMTLPWGWPEGTNTAMIVIRHRKAINGHIQAPQRWHDDINAFLLSLMFTLSSGDPNLYLCSHRIRYCCMLMISPCDIRRLLPKLQSKSKWHAQSSTRSETLARHANSSASRLTPMQMVPESVSIGKPISPPSSNNTAWSIVMASRPAWFWI